jgi:DNA (cytosine-5)-methyltransferase 1
VRAAPVPFTVTPPGHNGRVEAKGTAISLFSGAGGLDLGVEQAGYHVAAAVEMNHDAADTMEKNFPGLVSPVIRQSILDVPTREILRAAGLKGRERPDLLVGGPPCTPFSKSGFWLEWKRAGLDPDASLLQAYTRVLAEARPRAFILENVYALTYNNRASAPAFERLKREISEAGYTFTWRVLNAADYGVPQLRPRLFVIGVRKGQPAPELPEPTHTGRWERRSGSSTGALAHVTAGEALVGVQATPEPEETIRGQWAHLLPEVPPGGNYLHFTAERGHPSPVFEWRSRYWSFLLKLDPQRPSPTIQAQPGPNVGPFHWENRRLRIPELKRLFTFPDSFEFTGRRPSVQAQIGNSVPPLLAQRVARSL